MEYRVNFLSGLDLWPYNQKENVSVFYSLLCYMCLCNFNLFFTYSISSFHFIPRPLSHDISFHDQLPFLTLLLRAHLPKFNSDLSVHVFCCPPRAFTLPNDSLSLEPLTANGQAFCSPAWRPTTCQVTVATTAEGTGPVAIDTHPPTRLESVMCDLHPWFLSKRPHTFLYLSFIKQMKGALHLIIFAIYSIKEHQFTALNGVKSATQNRFL